MAFLCDADLAVQMRISSGTDGQLRCHFSSGGLGRVFKRQPSDMIWLSLGGRVIMGMKEGRNLIPSAWSTQLPCKLFWKCSVQEDHVLVGAREASVYV